MKRKHCIYHIGEASELTGLTQRTLRYYEELGLLGKRKHHPGKHRIYTDADVERIKKLLRMKQTLGLTLEQMVERVKWHDELDRLLTEADEESAGEVREKKLLKAREMLAEEIALLSERLALGKQHRRELVRILADVEKELAMAAYVEKRAKLGTGDQPGQSFGMKRGRARGTESDTRKD